MNNASRYTAPLAIVLLSLIATMATAIETVSPGAIDRMVEVESRFPTFSWGAEDDAAAYELVAYALPEDATQPVELTADTEVLFTRVVGSATSWTPSADQCFASGGRYVWFVRAVQQLVGDQVIEVSEWSAGRTFQVPTGPSVEDVAQAIEVLKWWQASNAGGSPTLFTATATATAAATVPASAADSGTGTGSGSTGHPKSVQTASAAIKGHNPELDAEAYGVVGTTDSVWGAGVAAVNTEGGPDLVLDGTLDGGADTRLSEWGIDRSDAVDQVFAVANSGGGAITLDVLGTLRGAALDCPGCIVPAALASEAVTSVAIEDGGITEVDIGIDAVNTTHIFDGSVQAQDLAADAVSGAAIADASITTADLADDAVTGAKIQNGAVSTNKLHDGAVTTEKIADDAVGAGQIAFESIGESELADDSVTHSKIVLGAIDTSLLADGAVTAAKLAVGAVDAASIRNNAITSDKIAVDAVSGANILDGSVRMSDLASESVGSDQIEIGGVQSVNIDALAVLTGHLADGSVTAAKLSAGAITGSTIEDGSITEADLAIAAVTTSKIQDQAVAGSKIASNAVTNQKIASGAVTGDKIAADAVTNDKLAAGAVAASNVVASEVQLRINTQCPVGSSIRVIDSMGGVSCETDDGADLTPPVEIIGPSPFPVLLVSNTGSSGAVYGVTDAPTPSLHGAANGDDGIGVKGEAFGASGVGVRGYSVQSVGVHGDGDTIGGHFEARHSQGVGILAVGGVDGLAARFIGNVLIRDRLTNDDIIELGKGLDYAEGFDVSDAEVLEPGTVLVIDPKSPGELTRSTLAYDTRVAGIIAGANGLGSGVRLGAEGFDHDVALAGRVYCKVDATAAEIRPGDLLTTSSVPGYAMKATNRDRAHGAILGKAMEPLAMGKTGQVLVLVGLQ